MGELTQLGLKPHSPYYGTADATLLWLILLSEYWRWTGDDELVRSTARRTPSRRSSGSIGTATATATATSSTRPARRRGSATSAGGTRGTASSSPTARIPYLPIATCEIQGYVYDAKRRMAELADGPLADAGARGAPAERGGRPAATLQRGLLDRRAGRLLRDRARRRQAPDRLADLEHRTPAVDRHRARRTRAAIVAGQLMSDALFSGWGVRTLSTDDAGVQPDRLSPRHGLAARQLAHRPWAWPGTASATRRTGSRWRCSRPRPSPATACPRRSPATRVGRALPDPLSDGVQPAGVGDRDAAAPPAGDARARGVTVR